MHTEDVPVTERSAWQFRPLLVHTLVVQTVTFVIRPTTSYRALELKGSGAVLGALSAAFALVPLVPALAVGRVTDRWGERSVTLLGGVGMCAATVLQTRSALPGLLGPRARALAEAEQWADTQHRNSATEGLHP